MKKKKGIFIGGVIGLIITISVYLIHTRTQCYNCGWLGIDHCGYSGLCEPLSFYMDIVNIVSIPFIIVALQLDSILPETIAPGLLNFSIKAGILYILYSAIVGYIIQWTTSKK